jgi:hypothetical protein
VVRVRAGLFMTGSGNWALRDCFYNPRKPA